MHTRVLPLVYVLAVGENLSHPITDFLGNINFIVTQRKQIRAIKIAVFLHGNDPPKIGFQAFLSLGKLETGV